MLTVDQDVVIVELPRGTGMTRVDLGAGSFVDVDRAVTDSTMLADRSRALDVARQLGARGVSERAAGAFGAAAAWYRFALLIACRCEDWDGVDALADNLERLDAVSDLRAAFPASDAAVAGRYALAAVDELLDGGQLAPALTALTLTRRLGALAGDAGLGEPQARRMLARRVAATAAPEALAFALGEIGSVRVGSLLAAAGLTPEPFEEFASMWRLYLATRAAATYLPAAGLLDAYARTYRHLEALRADCVAAGGAFGHHLSYAVSAYLQPVARDLVLLYDRAGESELSLVFSELVRARAMTDWAARTHASNRIVMAGDTTGSHGVVRRADLAEMRAAVAHADACAISYLACQDDYIVWLLRPDGEIRSSHIADPGPLVRELAGALADAALDPVSDHATDTLLARAGAHLLPLEIMAHVPDGTKRLIVLTDGAVEQVPFCALHLADGSSLLARYEVLYWPSVTGALLLQAGGESDAPALVCAVPSPPEEVSLGPEPDAPRVRFAPLTGAADEARVIGSLLHVAPRIGADASCEAVFAAPAGTPVIHLATHGMLNEARPERSFVVLADGVITADALFQYDAGVRATLVVLSACETALGGATPDSSIGLTNAFLIAGAGTVVSTLWRVQDNATAWLMTTFYRALISGESPAAALRAAQMATRKWPEWSDAACWAAFKVVGCDAPPYPRGRPPTRVP